MTTAACSACGKSLAQSDVLYDTEARVVCADCAGKAEIRGDERRAARNIKIAGITSAIAGVVAFFALGTGVGLAFWPAIVTTAASGVFAVNGMAGPGAARFVAYLTPGERVTTWVSTGIGFALGAYELLAIGGKVPFHMWVP
jgi:hypothetical protein